MAGGGVGGSAPPVDKPLVARDDVLGTALGDAHVLYDPRTGRAHVLNRSAATIWGMLSPETTISAVAARLATEIDASVDEMRDDVARTVAWLTEQDLVLISPGSGDVQPVRSPSMAVADDATVAPGYSTTTFEVLDQKVAFMCDRPALVADVEWYAAPLAIGGSPDRTISLAASDGMERTLPARMNRLAAESTTLTVLHAGAIVAGDAAIAFPGAPGSGKSTLVAGLVRRGYGYLTDEALGISADARVTGYPKRIALELGSWSLFPGITERKESTRSRIDPTRVRWVDPRWLHRDALAWRATGEPLRLACVVMASYEDGATPDLERLDPLDAMTALLADTFNLKLMGSTGLETLRDLATSMPFFRLRHGDMKQALPIVDELFREAGAASAS